MIEPPFPLHPIFVHFTVALTFSSLGAYVLGYIAPQGRLKNDLSVSSIWMLFFALMATLFTVTFGYLQYNSVKHDMLVHLPMTEHRNWGAASLVMLFISSLLALKGYLKNHIHSLSLTLSLLILCGMVGTTAYKGGELVYHYGLAVKSTPELREYMQKNETTPQHDNLFQPSVNMKK